MDAFATLARMSDRVVKRSSVAIAAIGVQACLGSVYAWSVFKDAIAKYWQADASGVAALNWAFSLAIGALGLTAAFASSLQARWGAIKCVRISALLFSGGMLLAALGISLHSLPLLLVGYGLLGGVGIGLGYAPPVMTLVRWFPQHKGLASGLVVGGFGIGSLLAAKILAPNLLKVLNPSQCFVVMALLYCVLLLWASRYMQLPPEQPKQAVSSDKAASAASQAATAVVAGEAAAHLSLKQALLNRNYYLLWFGFFLNIAMGIPLIANAISMANKIGGFDAQTATTIVGVMGLCNGFGRILWSSLSDKIGRKSTWFSMFVLQGALFVALNLSAGAGLYVLAVCLIMSAYGGGFALVPAHVSDMFGQQHASKIYGSMLTAWAMGALAATPLFDLLAQGGNYALQIYICAALSLLAFVCIALSRRAVAGSCSQAA